MLKEEDTSLKFKIGDRVKTKAGYPGAIIDLPKEGIAYVYLDEPEGCTFYGFVPLSSLVPIPKPESEEVVYSIWTENEWEEEKKEKPEDEISDPVTFLNLKDDRSEGEELVVFVDHDNRMLEFQETFFGKKGQIVYVDSFILPFDLFNRVAKYVRTE